MYVSRIKLPLATLTLTFASAFPYEILPLPVSFSFLPSRPIFIEPEATLYATRAPVSFGTEICAFPLATFASMPVIFSEQPSVSEPDVTLVYSSPPPAFSEVILPEVRTVFALFAYESVKCNLTAEYRYIYICVFMSS